MFTIIQAWQKTKKGRKRFHVYIVTCTKDGFNDLSVKLSGYFLLLSTCLCLSFLHFQNWLKFHFELGKLIKVVFNILLKNYDLNYF